MLVKSPTGIDGLDEITEGGLPQGRTTLICGSAGCGKTLLAIEFLVRGAVDYDEPGVFVTFEETAVEITDSSRLLLEELIPMLQQIAVPRSIRYAVDDAPLLGQQGVSLALIVNELVLNGLKHGLGDVEVTFRIQDKDACLEVCDDGHGLPEDFDPDVQASTGLTLLESLASMDLRGVTAYENRLDCSGARIKVTFPLTAL